MSPAMYISARVHGCETLAYNKRAGVRDFGQGREAVHAKHVPVQLVQIERKKRKTEICGRSRWGWGVMDL